MRSKRVTRGKLMDLHVERVDAVGSPATGHQWAIIKSEGEQDSTAEDAARAAVEALLKEDVALSKEAVEALHALAELLGIEGTFKSVDDVEDDEVEKDETVEDDRIEQLTETVGQLAEVVEQLAKGGKLVVRSRQPKEPGEPIKKGEGVFQNIIFGQK